VRRSACLRTLALILLALAPAPIARAAEGVKVDVSVDGLPAEMKRNVLASMMLSLAARQGRLGEDEARRLAVRAPREIEQALEPFGYYHPVVRDSLDTSSRTWKARFKVTPGPPVKIASVDLQVTGAGKDMPKLREAVNGFALKPGSRLQHAPYDDFKNVLARLAAQNGYLDATFTSSRLAVDPDADTAHVEIHFDTGERFAFGPVRFDQQVLDSAYVNSFVRISPGQPYNGDSLIAMQRALGQSHYFSRVEVEPRREEAANGLVPIDVRLEPAKRLRWSLGGGYGSEEGFEALASVELRRLNRKGHRASVDALVSQYRNTAGVQYQVPRAFGRHQIMTYSFALHDDETDAQSSRGTSFGVALTRERGRWETSYGVYFQRQTFVVGSDTGSPDLLFPEITWRRIVADDRLQPRAGYRLSATLRGASDQVHSDVTFVQTDLQTKGLIGLGSRGRLILRADAGSVWSDQFHQLPPNIRYFAGGPQSVRAYGYQDLAPRDSIGQTVGGERLLLGSVEYEYRIVGGWGAAGFYDIGNALEQFGDPLASGAGIGVRWFSPVGMVRLDLAWPISDPAHRSPHLQFSMGLDL